MQYKIIETDKPDNWPINMAEQSLESILIALDCFTKNPGYVTKETLISVISNYDLNERAFIGEYRVADYEVAAINGMYYQGLAMNLPSLPAYLYSFVGERARVHKMTAYILSSINKEKREDVYIEPYNGLCLSIKLYYFAYLAFNMDKDKPFAEKIIEVVEGLMSDIFSAEGMTEKDREEELFELSRSYTMMLNDLSYFHGNKKEGIWKFNREELTKLFNLEAKLIKLTHQKPNEAPLRGVLMTQISNFILKSRHDYNQDYICKYVSKDVAELSWTNREIWMNKIENLNDAREGNVLSELFEEKSWIDVAWVEKPILKPTRKYYVSSFSKSLSDDDMRDEYGEVVFGYKNDRIADLISPLHTVKSRSGELRNIAFSQVIAYDVLYDTEEAKEELNYLFKVIDQFDMDTDEKNSFLQSILQYWLLSIKDPKWSHERERRYVLFLYDAYDYLEMNTDDSFLKIKTSLFIVPDFLIGNHSKKADAKNAVDGKCRALSYRKYLYCQSCLNRDYDAVAGYDQPTCCPVCGSNNFKIVEPYVWNGEE